MFLGFCEPVAGVLPRRVGPQGVAAGTGAVVGGRQSCEEDNGTNDQLHGWIKEIRSQTADGVGGRSEGFLS